MASPGRHAAAITFVSRMHARTVLNPFLWPIQRLQLSRAKHPSLGGHARWSRRIARWVPSLQFGYEEALGADGAPEEVVARRRAAFAQLSQGLLSRARALGAGHARAGPRAARRRFLHALSRAVPVRRAGRAPAAGDDPGGERGAPGTRRRRPSALRRGRFLWRQRLRLRLLPRLHGARRRARPGAGSGARLPPSDHAGRGRAPAPRDGRGAVLLPHVRHRSGDAGGAPRAIPHGSPPSRPLLRRVPRLVGRRAARGRQSPDRARHLHAARHGRARARRSSRRATTSPACW